MAAPTSTQCKAWEAKRAFYLSKMWATPFWNPSRASYERRANAYAAKIAACEAVGKKFTPATAKTVASSTFTKGSATTPSGFQPATAPSTAAQKAVQASTQAAAAAQESAFQPDSASAAPSPLLLLGGLAAVGAVLFALSRKGKSAPSSSSFGAEKVRVGPPAVEAR